MSKYGTKCSYTNHKGELIDFDSIPEMYFYQKLEKFKNEDKIKDFKKEPAYELFPKFKTDYDDFFVNQIIKAMVYYPDYLITLIDDTQIIVDVKGGSAGVVEEVAKLKRKILLSRQPNIPIIFICMVEEKYLGGTSIKETNVNKHVWVNNTPGMSFYDKLKNKYKNLYPQSKGKTQKPVIWTMDDWDKYFEYSNVDDLFYIWNKTKKVK